VDTRGGSAKATLLVPSEANVAKKHHYLRTFFANRAKHPTERLREEVYTDESYIHEHYHQNEDSLFDPEDDQDVIYQKEKHKGRRYCFCAAIQGPNLRVEATESEDLAGLVYLMSLANKYMGSSNTFTYQRSPPFPL
jgi:hypothetical protein